MKHWLSAALGAAAWMMASGSTAPSLAAGPVMSAKVSSCPAQHLSMKDKQALKVLQQPPFPPTDKSLFTPQVYGVPATPPAGPYSFTEASLKAKLALLLARRFFGDVRKIKAGLAVYDDLAIKALVPDPRLRMALALLKGTAGESAIEAIRTQIYREVVFQAFPTPIDENVPAAVFTFTGETKPTIIFNPRYQHEDTRKLASIIAHEVLHRNDPNSNREELINTAIESLVEAQFLLESPSLAFLGTQLSRRSNTRLMARINDRDDKGNLRLLVSQGNLYPGGLVPLPYFAAGSEPLGADTPGNPTLQAMLQAVTKVRLDTPNFDDATVALLDTCQRLFSPSQVLQLAKILKLDTSGRTVVAGTERARERD